MRAGLRSTVPLLLAALTLSGTAQALQIVQTDNFNITSNGVASVGFQEFDPNLGTLDTVSVNIFGNAGFTVILAPGQFVAPSLGFDALGAGGRGFGFAGSGATLLFPPLLNGSTTAPNTFTSSTNFSLSFVLTAFTDLSGVVVPTVSAAPATIIPPTTVEAQRSDFVVGLAPVGIFETLLFVPAGFSPVQIFGGGSVQLIYDYTPAPVAVPAAPVAALFLSGLGAAALLRRRSPGGAGGRSQSGG